MAFRCDSDRTPPDLAHGLAVGPGHARDHRIRFAQHQQQRGEDVAVLIDHHLDFAAQIAAPLQPLVEIIDHARDQRGVAAVVQFEIFGIRDTQRTQPVRHLIAPDQHRRAVAAFLEGDRRAQHDFLLALREHDALGMRSGAVIGQREHGGGRVEPCAKRRAIFRHVEDRTPRHAGVHRRLGDRRRHEFHQPGIEGRRNHIVAAEGWGAAIGGGALFGHALARQLGQRAGGGDLHFLVDRRRTNVECAPEDERETEYVVDLIGIIGAARGDDRIGRGFQRILGKDFRIGIGHGENDRLGRHFAHHVLGQRACHGKTEKDVRALHRVGQRPRVGFGGVRRFPLVHAFGAATVDDALGIAHDDVAHAKRLGEFGAADRCRTRAVHDQFQILKFPPGQIGSIEQTGGRYDGGAVLVIVKHRYVHALAKRLLDHETFGRFDVLQIDAAEARLHQLDRVDEPVDIFGVELDVDGVDVGEPLEQHRLAFHHRLRGERAQISEPEDRGAVRDHRHQIALGGIIIGSVRISRDRANRHGHAGRIGKRKVPLGRHRLGGDDFDLARPTGGVEQQGLAL